MKVPGRNPFLKIASALLFLYFLVWISLEGRLWQSILLGVGIASLGAGLIWQRFFKGRTISLKQWLATIGLTGLLCGFSIAWLTILLMVIKTGLHGHGPEITPAEISWVVNQVPLWSAVGLLTGLGIGVLISCVQRE
jgi:hypothetical protein